MADRIFIKPAGKHYVRNPDAGMRHVAPEGEYVTVSSYWLRRIEEGEVREIENKDVEPEKGAK